MKLFKEAEIARFTPEQAESYEESLKHMRDYTNTIETAKEMAFDEGKIEGKLEGKLEGKIEGKTERDLEIAKDLILRGFEFHLVQEITGLSMASLEQLKS